VLKFAILTFGCRVNQADSLNLEAQLRARGADASPAAEADIVFVNTCSVTATADQGARQAIRRIARENPSARIVATGCYATRRPSEVEALPNVVRVVRNDAKGELLDVLERSTSIRFGGGDGPCGAPIAPGTSGRTAFTLRVQTGCEERCAYCIIPTTRGHGRSLPAEGLVREVERIAASGFKEIVLTGVHLGSYGRDLRPASSLGRLLAALESIDADVKFRISSLEPMDCTRGIVDVVARSPQRFAPHFHLPLQHGSDRILAAMRRPYSQDNYRRLVAGIVERMPHASIGTDMIVGFPTEGEDDFAKSAEYLAGSPLSHVHVFPYSDREGTEAARMPGKVAASVIRSRGAALRAIGSELTRRFTESQVGRIRPALTLEDGTLVVTDNYLKLRIAPGHQRNERLDVRVLSSSAAEAYAPCAISIASRLPGDGVRAVSVMS
jgi:threonylcarbamoyladenosine tRNA methylthiotransferase MtaB